MHPVAVLVVALVSVSEKYQLRAQTFRLLVKLVTAVFHMVAVSVGEKHLDPSRVVKIGVGSKGIIAVARYVEYHFFGVDYPQLVDLALAVAQENESVLAGIAFDHLSRGRKIAVGVGKNYKAHLCSPPIVCMSLLLICYLSAVNE